MANSSKNRLVIFSGSQYPEFAQKVAEHLGVQVSDAGLVRFKNSEINVSLGQSVRGANVFIFQTHHSPVNDAIMEQAIMIDAAKRASAGHITAVCPLLGYSRQDRKSKGREPISARLVIDILTAAGADRIVSVDLHTSQIQGFFDGPFDHLTAAPAIEDYIKKTFGGKIVMVAPDAGRVKQTERYASHLGTDMAIVHKRRDHSNRAEATTIIGDVKDKHCVINDDLIDTGGTIRAAAELLKKYGAKRISVVATHGVFSGDALKTLTTPAINDLSVTDTLPVPEQIPDELNLNIIPISRIVSDSIEAIHKHESVFELFKGANHS